MHKKSQHEIICKSLINEVKHLAPHSKLSSESQLCKQFGVSRMTVNKALTDLCSQNAIYRKKGMGSFVAPKRASTRTIKLLTPSINPSQLSEPTQYIMREIFEGISTCASSNCMKVELIPISETNLYGDIEWTFLDELKEGDYVVLNTSWFTPIFQFLHERKCNVLYIESSFATYKNYQKYLDKWFIATYDKANLARQVVEKLAEQNRQKVTLITPFDTDITTFSDCLSAAIAKSNIPLTISHTINVKGIYREPEKLVEALKSHYEQAPFDSIIFYNGLNMENIIPLLETELALTVPNDLSIINWNSTLPENDAISQKIINVKLPNKEMAQTCAKVAIDGNYEAKTIKCDAHIISNI